MGSYLPAGIKPYELDIFLGFVILEKLTKEFSTLPNKPL